MTPKEPDWELLDQMALPISDESSSSGRRWSADLFHRHMELAGAEILSGRYKAGKDHDVGRLKDSLQATLLAIHDHYPSVWQLHYAGKDWVKRLFPQEITGRLIKLRRIALTRIARFM